VPTDPVTLEVLKSYFVAIAEGMGHTLERTSHTTFIKETADFVTALATPTASSSPTRRRSASRASSA
jgi:N-methylhydantoinase B